jgi:hypothetical protein
LYYNGTYDQLATKYALYGGYGANTLTTRSDFDIDDKDQYADPENSDINLYKHSVKRCTVKCRSDGRGCRFHNTILAQKLKVKIHKR